jgi:diguanylate cyclase (GGDEF)-like protein
MTLHTDVIASPDRADLDDVVRAPTHPPVHLHVTVDPLGAVTRLEPPGSTLAGHGAAALVSDPQALTRLIHPADFGPFLRLILHAEEVPQPATIRIVSSDNTVMALPVRASTNGTGVVLTVGDLPSIVDLTDAPPAASDDEPDPLLLGDAPAPSIAVVESQAPSPPITWVNPIDPDLEHPMAIISPSGTIVASAGGFLGLGVPTPIRSGIEEVETSGGWYLLVSAPLPTLDPALAGHLVVHAVDISDRKRAEVELARQAVHDTLTNLPNRRLLFDRLDNALARHGRRTSDVLVVMFVDLDDFKVVNDTHGHDAGDAVIAEVAARLLSVVRAEDTVSRYAGDEFVVLAELDSDDQVVPFAKRIVETIHQPITLPSGVSVVQRISVGALVVTATDVDGSTVLRAADQAMYRSKQAGKGRVTIMDL